MPGLTASAIGLICLAFFVAFYALRILATTTAVLGLLWVVLLGTYGWIGKGLTWAATQVQHWAGTITLNAVGATFGGALTILLGVIYIHGLHPKNAAGRHHAWIGVALGALIVADVTGIPALSGLHSEIVNGAHTATTL